MRKTRSDKGKKRRPYREYAVLGLSGIALPSYLSDATYNMSKKENILKKRFLAGLEDWFTKAESDLKTNLRNKRSTLEDFNNALNAFYLEKKQTFKQARAIPAIDYKLLLDEQVLKNEKVFNVPLISLSENSILKEYPITTKKTVFDKVHEIGKPGDFISTYEKLRISPQRLDKQITNTSKLVRVGSPLLGLGLVGAGYYGYRNLKNKK